MKVGNYSDLYFGKLCHTKVERSISNKILVTTNLKLVTTATKGSAARIYLSFCPWTWYSEHGELPYIELYRPAQDGRHLCADSAPNIVTVTAMRLV